jgi:hypothetical protein
VFYSVNFTPHPCDQCLSTRLPNEIPRYPVVQGRPGADAGIHPTDRKGGDLVGGIESGSLLLPD